MARKSKAVWQQAKDISRQNKQKERKYEGEIFQTISPSDIYYH